jgi:hypothetical protein
MSKDELRCILIKDSTRFDQSIVEQADDLMSELFYKMRETYEGEHEAMFCSAIQHVNEAIREESVNAARPKRPVEIDYDPSEFYWSSGDEEAEEEEEEGKGHSDDESEDESADVA